jgi:dihydroxy-acid dehydratase
MTMGTASTMTSAVEALGFTLPGASSIPAADSRHAQMATSVGKRIVDMVWDDLKPSDILTPAAMDNAIVTVLGLGGSTNAIVHLIAMARRGGIALTLDRFDQLSRRVPVIANIRPSGQYLMEDFYYAGGLQAFLNVLSPHLDLGCLTITGKPLRDGVEGNKIYNDDVIRSPEKPIAASEGLVVLRGNLAPGGAVMKPIAAEPRFAKHTGRAIVFNSYDDMMSRIDDPDLDVDENSVLVLRNVGPKGGPGMPEWGQLPIPKKLLKKGVRDMLRISDCRMSGTSYGACILHVAPEAYVGGPLGLLHEGDVVELDVAARRLSMKVSDDELGRRRRAWQAPSAVYPRGYGRIFVEHITQADEGCDFDFLEAGGRVPEPEIH